jgi:enterochelin esterase-like enzyme
MSSSIMLTPLGSLAPAHRNPSRHAVREFTLRSFVSPRLIPCEKRRHTVLDALLSIDVLDGAVPVIVFALAVGVLCALLIRPVSRRWLRRLAVAAAGGLLASIAAWLILVRWLNVFGESPGLGNYVWATAAFCGVALCAVSIGRSPWWRTAVAIVGIPVFIITATLGINLNYGLDRTLGNVLAITVPSPIQLRPPAHRGSTYDTDLWQDWKAPAGMPQRGKTGTATIPARVSGFHARQAGIYLPPAALVAKPPALPLLVMMMGQPGNPDPQPIATVLDELAARHNGLAPVVVVADQLGDPLHDTLCLDTPHYGNVETYIARDVTAWAEKNLPITVDHRFWSVAGYSNGGLCALSFGLDHPDVFANILDISGEEFPGAEHPQATLAEFFGGDQAAYDRAKPLVRIASSRYPGALIFTACRDDPVFHQVAVRGLRAALRAGVASTFVDLRTGGHGIGALMGGLQGGLPLLYGRLGLQPPR